MESSIACGSIEGYVVGLFGVGVLAGALMVWGAEGIRNVVRNHQDDNDPYIGAWSIAAGVTGFVGSMGAYLWFMKC